MGKLFGTDGIRGRANLYPMTPEVALRIGRAIARYFRHNTGKPRVVIGKDTRISGDMLEAALASGICSMGMDACLAGVLPTPGVAFLTAGGYASAGVMVSASHNPFYDNGLKIFDATGYKLTDAIEEELEALVLAADPAPGVSDAAEIGRVLRVDDAGQRYRDFLGRTLPEGLILNGVKVALDCANGATYRVAPELLTSLGAQVEARHVLPDGENINAGCGSQHLESLIAHVAERGAHLGLAFDGDGDRLIAVDEKGAVVSGDQIIAVCARHLKKTGRLAGNRVVTTVMSNLGLRIALKKMGIEHLIADVGDRYVLAEMVASGAVLGGEDSGHVIFLAHHTTGDGLLTALRLLEVLQAEGKPLSELAAVMAVLPQVLLNIEVARKPDLETIPAVMERIRSVEATLGDEGRVVVRYSGTQPLCRVMIEGPSREETQRCAHHIAEAVESTLGLKQTT